MISDKSVHLSPLAFLLGVEGAALLRGFREGTADRAFVTARLAEVRGLLEDTALGAEEGVDATLGGIDTSDVYRDWAPSYDRPGNQMIDIEEPIVQAILNGLPAGDALDAACGTGRHTAHLLRRGHRVIGVDASPEMLTQARIRFPDADLRLGDLEGLPLADSSVDLVVCALALVHVADVPGAMREFARVLRPGGNLVISDPHLVGAYLVPRIAHAGRDGRPALPRKHHRLLSAYLAAALPLGFAVRRCEEPVRPPTPPDRQPGPLPDPPRVSWELLDRCPSAAAAVMDRSPLAVIWHFRLAVP